jgi:hypothetical protein
MIILFWHFWVNQKSVVFGQQLNTCRRTKTTKISIKNPPSAGFVRYTGT